MSRNSARKWLGALAAVFALAPLTANALPLVTQSSLDSFADALSGKNGSTDGTNTTDPLPVGGTGAGSYGAFTNPATAGAGPVLPLDPRNVPFPGTSGVSSGRAVNSLSISASGGQTTIAVSLSAFVDFLNMDGGVYGAHAAASFFVDFTLDAPTAFTLTGTSFWNANDLIGQLGINAYLGGFPAGSPVPSLAAPHGGSAPTPFSYSGIIDPANFFNADAFRFNANVFVSGSPISTGDFSDQSSLIATLVLNPRTRQVPEPSSLALLGAGLLGLVVRRRRKMKA